MIFYRILLWIPVIGLKVLILYLTTLPWSSPLLHRLPLPLGLLHFLGYGFLSFFLYLALAGGLRTWKGAAAWGTLLIVLVYGALAELSQLLVPDRIASPVDILINGAGAATMLILIRLWCLLVGPADPASPADPGAGRIAAARRFSPAGAAVYLALITGTLLRFPLSPELFGLLAAFTVLFLAGMLPVDKYYFRYLAVSAQLLAAAILVLVFRATVYRDLAAAWPPWIFEHSTMIMLLVGGWTVLMINLFQLVEGLDGLSAALTFAASGALAVIMQRAPALLPVALALLILAGALGLYPGNLQPRLVPLGSSGQMLLGFGLAALFLYQLPAPGTSSLVLTGLLLLVLPAADIVFTLSVLLPGKKRPVAAAFQGSSDHPPPNLRRAVYLVFILAAAGAVYRLYQPQSFPEKTLLFLLGIFALPGAFYWLFYFFKNGALQTKSTTNGKKEGC